MTSTPRVVVTPETFRFVSFDAEVIRTIAASLASSIGLADHDIHVEIDETTPLGRMTLDLTGGRITIRAESGAFEDTRRPRQQSETAVATSLGRALLRARDRLDGAFGGAPSDDELTLAQVAAWETYSVGRLGRLGVATNEQRWRYNFRNRHGFSDTTDAAFDRLWEADALTWDELAEISREAAATTVR